MAEEIRRIITIKIDDIDEKNRVVYLRIEEGGTWLGTIPIKLSDLAGVEDRKAYIKTKVLEFIRAVKLTPLKPKDLSKYKDLEMEVEV